MTDQVEVAAKQIPTAQEPTEEELSRLAQVERLDETDFLKVRLLNRNLELFDSQAENIQLRQQHAMLVMQEFGTSLVRRYGLQDISQVDPGTGEIKRGEGTPDAK